MGKRMTGVFFRGYSSKSPNRVKTALILWMCRIFSRFTAFSPQAGLSFRASSQAAPYQLSNSSGLAAVWAFGSAAFQILNFSHCFNLAYCNRFVTTCVLKFVIICFNEEMAFWFSL